MTGSELFREIGNISEEYILEAEKYQKKAVFAAYDSWRNVTDSSVVRQFWQKSVANNAAVRKTLTAAACFAVCVGLVFLVQKTGIGFDAAKSESMMEKAYDAEIVMESSKASSNNMAVTKEEMKEECAEEEKAVLSDQYAAQGEQKGENGNADSGQNKEAESLMEEIEDVNPEGSGRADSLLTPETYNEASVKERLAEYSNDYQQLLQEENALVVSMGEVRNGQEKWDAFLVSAEAGEAAWVDVIVFSIEGDAIIRNIYFDGSVYRLCTDKTRDAYLGIGADPYDEETFRYLRRVEETWEDGTEVIEYVLSDQPNDGVEQNTDVVDYSIFQIYK